MLWDIYEVIQLSLKWSIVEKYLLWIGKFYTSKIILSV